MIIYILIEATARADVVCAVLDGWLPRLRAASRVYLDDFRWHHIVVSPWFRAKNIPLELASKYIGASHTAMDSATTLLAVCDPEGPARFCLRRCASRGASIALISPDVDLQPPVFTGVDPASGPDWGVVFETRPEQIVAVDFDGTVVEHKFPLVGADVPGAVYSLRQLTDAGVGVVLWTMRSGQYLDAAIAWYRDRNIPLYGVNRNPTQSAWTTSPKAYADQYVDDAAVGCPLVHPQSGGRPYVDWPRVMATLHRHNAGPIGGHPDEPKAPQVELPL